MKKDSVKDILEALKDSVDKWSNQGRTPEQIWAVKNYLTGAGRNGIKELLAAKDQEKWQAKRELIGKVKDWVEKERNAHLGYCKSQNGRDDCKNCGLEDGCFEKLFEIFK